MPGEVADSLACVVALETLKDLVSKAPSQAGSQLFGMFMPRVVRAASSLDNMVRVSAHDDLVVRGRRQKPGLRDIWRRVGGEGDTEDCDDSHEETDADELQWRTCKRARNRRLCHTCSGMCRPAGRLGRRIDYAARVKKCVLVLRRWPPCRLARSCSRWEHGADLTPSRRPGSLECRTSCSSQSPPPCSPPRPLKTSSTLSSIPSATWVRLHTAYKPVVQNAPTTFHGRAPFGSFHPASRGRAMLGATAQRSVPQIAREGSPCMQPDRAAEELAHPS